MQLVTNIQLADYKIVTFTDYINENKELYINLKKELREKADKVLYDMYLKNNRVFPFNNNDDFERYSNGQQGVIFLVDEIQLYLNSLQSKNINLDVITQISQQRKQRKHIVCTSQVFGRMAKPLREQFSTVILCKNYLGCIQYNQEIDRDSMEGEESTSTNIKGKVKKKYIYIHTPDYYKRYDTYYVIEKGKFVAGEEQKDIYNTAETIVIENEEGGKKK